MRKLLLLVCVVGLLNFSGCNQGEINLLKEQVAELKKEKQDLQKRLDEANEKLAKSEAKQQQLATKTEGLLKKLMPDVDSIGDIMETAKELGLPELKDFKKEDLLKKATEGVKKAIE